MTSNHLKKAEPAGLEPDPGATCSNTCSKKPKNRSKRRASNLNRGPGGGVKKNQPEAGSNPLIDPEKKCDKGAYREDELANRMGIARQYLRNFRDKHLTEGKEWSSVANAVVWHDTAIDGLLNILRLDLDEIPTKNTPHLLQVSKFYTNKWILGCIDPAGEPGVLQNVWVRNSKMFNFGQLVPVEFQGNKLVLACRHPRTKGKIK